MDRRMLFSIAAAALIIATFLLTNSASPGSGGEIILMGFDPGAAEQHVVNLISHGPRFAGGDAERLGAEYVLSQFVSAGLSNAHIETYQAPVFEVLRARMRIVEYGPMLQFPRPSGEVIRYQDTLDFVVQGYSGSYVWSSFTDDLEIVMIGDGSNREAYSSANGKVALIEMGDNTPGNPVVFAHAYEAGVSAVLLQNLMWGEEIGHVPFFKGNYAYESWEGEFPEIPMLVLSKDAGQQIKELSSTYKLRLEMDVWKGMKDIPVVVGDIPGSDPNGDLYIIGAHLDTCYNTLGVVDNTVGPATILEMARQMAKHSTKHTIRFCAWGAEELGLFGSRLYFEAHREEMVARAAFYSNFDMSHIDPVRSNRMTVTTSCNNSLHMMEHIRDEMIRTTSGLDKYDIVVAWNSGMFAGSDHWPFVSNGIDVANAFGSGCEEYHTYKDDMSRLNSESLQIGARIVGSYVLTMASR
ncbi:MAG: M28 family peptidase [Candidatus Thermoplasmatota archaeon]|nr:M28 family peptidase [Candidatus Thermoplasmatota archaeon]